MAARVNGTGSRFEVGDITPLFRARPAFGRFPFDVSADGEKFLVLTTEEQSAPEPLVILVNWTAALRNGPVD
jgi:hypothetical protein